MLRKDNGDLFNISGHLHRTDMLGFLPLLPRGFVTFDVYEETCAKRIQALFKDRTDG